MAEAAVAAEAQPAAEGGGAAGRRRRQVEMPEVVDELSQENPRTPLLAQVEGQLKGRTQSSRLLIGFGVVDDRFAEEFSKWRVQNEQEGDVSGLLLFTSQGAVHFMEGPTELLFSALAFHKSLASEAGGGAEEGSTRQPMIGPVRVLHFTEMHGVRATSAWCSYSHPGKMAGGQQAVIEETNSAECMFKVYMKLLVVCAKAQGDSTSTMQSAVKKAAEQLPAVDDVALLLGKAASEFFFSCVEFEEVFVAPFNLVLHSELLWPMPAALSY